MNFLTTGGEGLIGKALIKRLIDIGHNHLVDFDKINGDYELFPCHYKPDIIFHLASNCKINKCIEYPILAFENSKITEEILELCKWSNSKIVLFSSSRVLNKEKNPYVSSKIYGEELVKAYHECYGIDYIIIRPSTVYGFPSHNKRLIDIWIENAKQNKDLIIYGDKNKTLSFTYIDDFVDGVIYSLGDFNREINIAGKEEKLIDVAKLIIELTNSKSKIIFKDKEIAQPQKVKCKSHYKCQTSIKEGLKKII